jgi:hypothetical protein
MEKLAIIKEGITPESKNLDESAFECDDKETGEAVIVKKAELDFDNQKQN